MIPRQYHMSFEFEVGFDGSIRIVEDVPNQHNRHTPSIAPVG